MVLGHDIQQIRCSSVETSAERSYFNIFQPDKQPTTGSELNAHPSPSGPGHINGRLGRSGRLREEVVGVGT